METTSQCLLFNTDKIAQTTQIGAAVMLPDMYMAVAGFVGDMPAKIANLLYSSACMAGVTRVVLEDDELNIVFALCWNNFPVKKYYHEIAVGIAASATRAILREKYGTAISSALTEISTQPIDGE